MPSIVRATNVLIAGKRFVVAGYGWVGRGVAMRAKGLGAHVIARAHMERMKDGAILCNTGHFNVEIEIAALRDLASETRAAREFVEEYTLADGRRVYLIADGRLVNLAAAEGHPAIVMDMSFANQALSAEYVVQHAASLEKKVYVVPKDIDDEIARLKLATMGIDIDTLTEEQAKYLASWDEGT